MKRFLFFVVALVFATGIQAQKIDARLTKMQMVFQKLKELCVVSIRRQILLP